MKLNEYTLRGKEVCEILAGRQGISVSEAKDILSDISEIVSQSVMLGYRVHIPNLCIFYTYSNPPRKLINPVTREPMEVPKGFVLSVKANQRIKDLLRSEGVVQSTVDIKKFLAREKTEEIVVVRRKQRQPKEILRKHFLTYLLEGFHFGKSWTHPQLEREFKTSEIRASMERCRDSQPMEYSCLFSRLSPDFNIKDITDIRRITPKIFRTRLNSALDTVIWHLITKDKLPSPNISRTHEQHRRV